MRLLKQLFSIFVAVGLLLGLLFIFTYDVVKIDWVVFMEVQQSYKPMEDPLPLPARSIPIEGAVSIPNMGAPTNPVPADETSVVRGAQLYGIHCAMCHGAGGLGNGQISAFLEPNKPANLTSDVVQSKSDGALFLTITNGVDGRMPPLNENLLVRERWDVINFLRTLTPPQE